MGSFRGPAIQDTRQLEDLACINELSSLANYTSTSCTHCPYPDYNLPDFSSCRQLQKYSYHLLALLQLFYRRMAPYKWSQGSGGTEILVSNHSFDFLSHEHKPKRKETAACSKVISLVLVSVQPSQPPSWG